MTHRQKSVDGATDEIVRTTCAFDSPSARKELRKILYSLYDKGYEKKSDECRKKEFEEYKKRIGL